ncbi:MAG TPA: hypothetical protein VF260_01160 [Bacilli bacterium]
MLAISAILFAIAALGGLALGSFRARGQKMPMWLSIIHGLVAAAGLVFLIIGVAQGEAGTLATVALVLFIIAALGGFVLFSYHLRDQQHPKSFIAVHALVAVVAFVLLLIGIL